MPQKHVISKLFMVCLFFFHFMFNPESVNEEQRAAMLVNCTRYPGQIHSTSAATGSKASVKEICIIKCFIVYNFHRSIHLCVGGKRRVTTAITCNPDASVNLKFFSHQ